MSNDYFNPPEKLEPKTKARSVDINTLSSAVATAFDKLPDEKATKDGTLNYAVATGTANALAIDLPNAPESYTDGLLIEFKAATASTGTALTVNVNGLGVVAFVREDGSACKAGDIVAGMNRARYSTTTGKFHLNRRDAISLTEATALLAGGALPADLPITSLGKGSLLPGQVVRLNAAGDALEGGADGLFLSSRNSNVELGAGDNAKLVNVTGGTFTQTIAPAATLGDGWFCWYQYGASAAGQITLDPAGDETIDGVQSIVFNPGDIRLIQSDGTALRSFLINEGRPILDGAATLRKNADYILRAAGNYVVPDLAIGERLGIQVSKTVSAAGNISLNSADGWVYATATAGTVDLINPVATGKRPYFGVGSNPTPPLLSGATTSNAVNITEIAETSTRMLFYDANFGNGFFVSKANGAISASGGMPDISFSVRRSIFGISATKFTFIGTNSGSESYVHIVDAIGAPLASLNFGAYPTNSVAQLDDTNFIVQLGSVAANLFAVNINPNTNVITKSAAGAAGHTEKLVGMSSTTFLTSQVTTTGQAVRLRAGSIAGTVITQGAEVLTAETNHTSTSTSLIRLSDTKAIVLAFDNTLQTTRHIYGVTLTGTAVAVTPRKSIAGFGSAFFNDRRRANAITDYIVLDSDRVLVKAVDGYYVIKFTDDVVTIGAKYAVASPLGLLQDMETKTNLYEVVAAGWRKISVSDTTISVDYSVSSGGQVSIIFKEGLTNREYKGANGIWYAWGVTMQALSFPITATSAIQVAATSSTRGSITL